MTITGLAAMDNTSSNSLHVMIISSPEAGHIIPVHILANRLADHHGVRSTVLQVTIGPSPEYKLVNPPRRKELVEVIKLPPVDISNLIDPSTTVVTRMCLMMRVAVPHIRSAIAAMDRRPDALIVVHFGTDALQIAAELNIPTYLYCTSTAWFLALTVYCQILDKEIKGQYIDEPGPLKIPGCKPVRPEDIVDMMLDRDNQQYREYLKMGIGFTLCDGILLNSCEDFDANTLHAFRENEAMESVLKSPVYPIGPLTRPIERTCSKSELTDWLDKQPDRSVLFISFGSGGVLSVEQTTELAWGLELSQQRFIWVIRPPKKGHVDEEFFPVSNEWTEDCLPEGFLNRTKNTGVVVPLWAQPLEILAHPSAGGFLSHCGWNSTIESIMCGVPMIAWPLYAEQRMNAAFLAEDLGVAVRPEVLPTKQVVGRKEIEKMVRTLMEKNVGQAMRNRVTQLKTIATNGLNKDGSSHISMCRFLSDLEAKKKVDG